MSQTETQKLSREESIDLLDKVFEKVKLELQAKQYVDERLNQTVEFPNRLSTDGGTVHLFQRIEEESQNPLDDETIGWTVTNLEGGVVTAKNQPAWDRTKEIEPSELSKDRYTVKTTSEGLPRFAY